MLKVLELVKYMWTFYKDRIIQNYCALFPDIEKRVKAVAVNQKSLSRLIHPRHISV
jgi:hypothetical protein